MTSPTLQSIEKELEEIRYAIDPEVDADWWIERQQKLFRKALSEQISTIRKEVEGMRKEKVAFERAYGRAERDAHNAALDQIISYLDGMV